MDTNTTTNTSISTNNIVIVDPTSTDNTDNTDNTNNTNKNGIALVRSECVCCCSKLFNHLITLDNFPVNSGTTAGPEKFTTCDMVYGNCNFCNQIQLLVLVNLDLLYKNGHNASIVGKTWTNHYVELVRFIRNSIPNIDQAHVLDIGDPNFKVARHLVHDNPTFTGTWTCIDPNIPTNTDTDMNTNRVSVIPSFFDQNFKLNDGEEKYNVILHSHLFEHTYKPREFLKKCHSILADDGYMCFSVPNMTHLTTSKAWPFTGVFFEHTFHLSEYNLRYLLTQTWFTVVSTYNYLDHSNFYLVKKADNYRSISVIPSFVMLEYNTRMLDFFKNSTNNLHMIGERIKSSVPPNSGIFLYGAHYNTQVLMHLLKLDEYMIINILDKDPNKIGRYLYGTNLLVLNPDVLREYSHGYVVVSHMGVYKDEIAEQIRNMNLPGIVIL